MKQITSAKNPLFKDIKSIAHTAKARRERAVAFIEGVHLSESFLAARCIPVWCIVSESALDNTEVKSIVDRCNAQGVEIVLLGDSLFAAMSTVETAVGVALVVSVSSMLPSVPITENALILDDVQDPGNVGTILRTAAAAGVKEIYCSPATASLWSPKVLRAGMGAHVALKLHEQCDIRQLIEAAKLPVFATSLDTQTTLYESDVSKGAVWVFGNEGQGVSSDILMMPQVRKVFIPQTSGVESLNVAAATAVCLFEQRRQQLLSR